MKKTTYAIILSVIFSLSVTGCAADNQVLPTHDEVLTYQVPYDLAFLRTIEALESLPDWELSETEKEKGIIRVNNTNFATFDDADKREATFIVKRVNRKETSIALAPYSQQVIGAKDLFKRISQYVGTEADPAPEQPHAAQPVTQ